MGESDRARLTLNYRVRCERSTIDLVCILVGVQTRGEEVVLAMPSIRLISVTKRFKDNVALDRASLNVRSGEYVCVLGPTGSGKTTLLRVIAGLTQPDSGQLLIDGKSVDEMGPEDRGTAYVPQQYALFPHLTVLQNVAFSPLAKGYKKAEAFEIARKVLQTVKLAHREGAFPSELSGGMQQRVTLARGIASGARLLLLDEPLGALDARLRMELRTELRRIAKDLSLTAIHVTHDQKEAMSIADTIVVLKDGNIQQTGSPFHLYQDPASIFVSSFVGGSNFLPGVVVGIEGTNSLVELRDGIRIRVHQRSHRRGEPVILSVRQELTILRNHADEKENAIPGEIRGTSFVGDAIEYDVELDNRETVKCKVPSYYVSEGSLPFQTGERVFVTIDPHDCNLYSEPPLGLAKELEAF